VNAATATFNQNNNLSYGTSGGTYNNSNLNNTTAKLSSNVSYSKRFTGSPFSLGLNLSHNQDLKTKVVDLLLPNLSFNMANIYPFQSKKGKTGPLDNFSVAYTMNAVNRVTNNLGRLTPTATKDSIADFSGSNFGTFFANGKKGMRHNIPASFSLKFLRFLTLSPSMNYEEKWYGEQLTWGYNKDSLLVRTDTVKGFHRIANYSFSVGLTTRFYGMYHMKNKAKNVKAIRHIINPSISFGLTPDFTKNPEYFQFMKNKKDTTQTFYQDRFQGSVYGGSNPGKSGSIGFGLGNNVEMKVQKPQDSVARKVMLLNNLSISSSYNLIADEFKLAPFGISANTNVLDNLLNINLAATLDPYTVLVTNEEGVRHEERIDELAWKTGSIGRITSASLAMSTNLNPKARSKETSSREKISKSDLPEQEKEFLLQNPDAYVDFEIPWSMNINYTFGYSHPVNVKESVTSTIQHVGRCFDICCVESDI
jgi:hypothetical protein